MLAGQNASFASVSPILAAILAVNIVNELIKVARRLIVEDTATQAEKTARQRAALSLLMAPLSYFRAHMTGNIHGRLNRSLEGTVKLIKLIFMDFAPAVTTGLAAVVTIFTQPPVSVAWLAVLVIPVGTFIVFRQIGTQKDIRVELMETKADMDGAMVELPGGIEAIRALDSAQTEGARIEARSEQLRKKEMRHRRAMAFYDCLKFVNEAFFSVLVIGLSVLLASRGAITAWYGAHGLPVLYPAHRPASGAAPHPGRIFRMRGAGKRLLPAVGPAAGFLLSGCGRFEGPNAAGQQRNAEGRALRLPRKAGSADSQ